MRAGRRSTRTFYILEVKLRRRVETDATPNLFQLTRGNQDLAETLGFRYTTQCEEHGGGAIGSRISQRRQEINSSKVSTVNPSSRSRIICSTLSPACSPAMASFSIAIGVCFSPYRTPTGIGAGSHVTTRRSVIQITSKREPDAVSIPFVFHIGVICLMSHSM